jgi:SAM-dependent methyltransferase
MDTDKVFAGAVPQIYDRHLGPILFQPFAEVVAARLRESDRAILETAAGTGVVTRAMAAARPRSAILATDLNQAMLDVAAARTAATNVTWRQADAQALAVESGKFDVVVCCFGLMFMPDKPAAYRQARRALRPGGRFIFTVWERIDANPLMHLAEEGVAKLFRHDPPRFFSRTPCGYSDRARIEKDAREGGFGSVAIEEVRRDGAAPSAGEAAMGFCQGTPLRTEIEARDANGLGPATEAAAAALRERFGDGPFRAPQQALLATAS